MVIASSHLDCERDLRIYIFGTARIRGISVAIPKCKIMCGSYWVTIIIFVEIMDFSNFLFKISFI